MIRPERQTPPMHPASETVCAVCGHPVIQLGNEWACVNRCRCLMMGCVPDEGRPPVSVSSSGGTTAGSVG